MYVIVGLGNPDRRYAGTRHNVGFDVIDCLAERYQIRVEQKKNRAYVGSGFIEGTKVLLAKPQTYMNLSGESVRGLVDFYKIDPADELVIICDDVNLDVGQLRIRRKGSAGGHNGLKNIILHLGRDDFARIRIGVGKKPPRMDLADYVLGHFLKEEQEDMIEAYKKATEAVSLMSCGEITEAMNRYNRKAKAEKKEETGETKDQKKEQETT